MRQENERLRGQLNSMCAANVHLILKDNENKKAMEGYKKKMEEKDRVICEKEENIGMLQDKVRGITREHVTYILSK